MLPRITAALSEFVSPIARGTQAVQAGTASQFKRFEETPHSGSKEKQQRPPEPKSEAPPDQLAPEAARPLAEVIPIRAAPEALKESGLASTLIQLMALFKEHRATLIRALGLRTYAVAERRQRKSLSSRKGAILDRRAE